MSGMKDFSFVNKMNRQKVEPQLKPGETAVEYLQRVEQEKMEKLQRDYPSQQPQYQQPHPPHDGAATPPPQEVVFYEGYKLSRDFFTCVALCIMKLNDPEINKIFATFGFNMKDLNGKPVILKRKKSVRRKAKVRKK